MADDIDALEEQLDAKFQEILEAVASQLKLGNYDDLSDDDQERVETEAETATDKWMEETEDTPKEPTTPFEKLLAEYTAIVLKFPDMDDEDDEDGDQDADGRDRKK